MSSLGGEPAGIGGGTSAATATKEDAQLLEKLANSNFKVRGRNGHQRNFGTPTQATVDVVMVSSEVVIVRLSDRGGTETGE